jgi:hypothetical protein
MESSEVKEERKKRRAAEVIRKMAAGLFKEPPPNMIRNPKTGRPIKIGGGLHRALVLEGVMGRETLDIGKVSIVADSRQKMPMAAVESFEKTTHWTNVKEISKAIGCSTFAIIEWFTKEFDEMKICYRKDAVRIIFPGKEPFIQRVVHDFITAYSKKNKLDATHWNQ